MFSASAPGFRLPGLAHALQDPLAREPYVYRWTPPATSPEMPAPAPASENESAQQADPGAVVIRLVEPEEVAQAEHFIHATGRALPLSAWRTIVGERNGETVAVAQLKFSPPEVLIASMRVADEESAAMWMSTLLPQLQDLGIRRLTVIGGVGKGWERYGFKQHPTLPIAVLDVDGLINSAVAQSTTTSSPLATNGHKDGTP